MSFPARKCAVSMLLLREILCLGLMHVFTATSSHLVFFVELAATAASLCRPALIIDPEQRKST